MITNIDKQKKLNLLNDKENFLIQNFQSHPLFRSIELMSWEEFINILVQRRFLSLSIVNTYELVLDSLQEKQEKIKKTVREILYEEYPRKVNGIPLFSHRELLFKDLINLGATREKILNTSETSVTKMIREEGLKIFSENFDQEFFELGLVTALRFWGEVMVAEEYKCLWKKISEKLSSPNEKNNKKSSKFYYYHMVHDERRLDIGQNEFFGICTHSQKLAIHLAELINSEQDIQHCIDIEEKIYDIKYRFYNQFI